MNKKIWTLVFVGLFLRLLISPFTYHSDIQTFDFGGYVLSQGYVSNFYDFLPNLDSSNPIKNTFPSFNFNYPPAVYLVFGIIANIFVFLVGEEFRYNFLFNIKSVLGSLPLFLHLLTLKLPLLAFDIGVALLLAKLITNEKLKLLVVGMWLFNPITIYSTTMMGQFDIVPTFFTVLSLYLLKKNGVNQKGLLWAAVCLGIGSAFKIYPLFLLVPLMGLTEKWSDRIKVGLVGIAPYLLTVLPFLPSSGFRSSALVAGQTLKSFYAQIPLSGGESILLFPAVLIFFYIIFLMFKGSVENLWERYLIVLLLFFIFTHFHPQWLLWLTPFLILAVVHSGMKLMFPKILIYLSWFGMLFFFDPGLNIGLSSPIFPNLYDSISIWQMLGINIDYNFSRSILQSIFAGAAIYFLYYFFPLKKEN